MEYLYRSHPSSLLEIVASLQLLAHKDNLSVHELDHLSESFFKFLVKNSKYIDDEKSLEATGVGMSEILHETLTNLFMDNNEVAILIIQKFYDSLANKLKSRAAYIQELKRQASSTLLFGDEIDLSEKSISLSKSISSTEISINDEILEADQYISHQDEIDKRTLEEKTTKYISDFENMSHEDQLDTLTSHLFTDLEDLGVRLPG